jgi:peptidoglycan/LPS O-acetylase OafA/YrhL
LDDATAHTTAIAQGTSVVARRATVPWSLGHRPALDGLRGIAVLLVMLGHFGVPGFGDAGVVGVSLFFVLSG